MLYQPSYPYPYLTDIDATLDNNFTCIINSEGGTDIVAYKLIINDLNNNEIYNSTKKTLSAYLYNGDSLSVQVPDTTSMVNGTDYVWNITLYEQNPTMWVTYGTIQGASSTTTNIYLRHHYNVSADMYVKIGTESRKISTYDMETGIAVVSPAFTSAPADKTDYNIYTNFVKSSDIYFKARTTPTISISYFMSVIPSRKHTFIGTYTQPENVAWKYFIWNLYDVTNQLIETSGQINTGQMQHTFDGFIDGTTYKIQLVVENQDGVILNTSLQSFTVDYESAQVDNVPVVELLCDKTALQVAWSQPLINSGFASGDKGIPYYTLVPNVPYPGGSSVLLTETNYIYWETSTSTERYEINSNSTAFLNCTFPIGFSGSVVKMETLPTRLLTVGSEPIEFEIGDKYYNTITNLIYVAISEVAWSSQGLTPSSTTLYQAIDTSIMYLYENGVLTVTTATVPYYYVYYDDGKFYYNINNMTSQYTGYVTIADSYKKWLLQPENASIANNYIWIDDENWADNLFWTEQQDDIISNNWWKITLLPNSIQVYMQPFVHYNIFSTPNTSMSYESRLFDDSVLIDTDVLYN